MTFWQFLKQRAKTPGALGDFAREAIADPRFPRRRGVTYLDIMDHLDRQSVPDDAIWAFLRDFNDWTARRDPGRAHGTNVYERLGHNIHTWTHMRRGEAPR